MKCFWFIVFFPTLVFAKWNNSYEFETWGVHERIANNIFGETYAHDDSISKLEARLRYKNGIFNFTADPQIRLLGTSLESQLAYPSSLYKSTIQAPHRGMKLESPLWGDSTYESQASFERLTLGLKTQNTELVVGRQPFSLGVMKVVPIWNRFIVNMPLPGLFLQFPDRDGVAFRYQNNIWNLQAFSIFASQDNKNAYLIENTFNFDSFELRLLGGFWERNLSGGVAASLPFLNGTLRAEFLGVGWRSNDPTSINQFGFGFETAFSAKWSLLVESLYLSSGSVNQNNYDVSQLNSFRPLLGEDYLVFQLKYEGAGFFTFEPQVVLNAIDGSSIVGGELLYSLGDHSELSCQIRFPTGSRGQEFSTYAAPIERSGPIGTAEQIFLKYRLFY